MNPDVTEWIGYFAMVMLVVSFIPKQLKLIRILNLIGCIAFVVYGVFLGWTIPIIVSNGLVAIIQVVHLAKTKKEKTQ
ncbi:MAG TPA: uroporphyrinogen decarboxylase [Edaphocola sp.]|nr:uroporphyrinogen decarboxylase [Edaphocola sp.]